MRLARGEHAVKADQLFIAGRFAAAQVVEEVIGVEGAEGAGAGSGVQAPDVQIVAVTAGARIPHVRQWEAVDKQRVFAAKGAAFFFGGKAQMQLVRAYVLRAQALALAITQQLPADKTADAPDLVIQRAGAEHLALSALWGKRAERDRGGAGTAEILEIILVKVAVQHMQWNPAVLAGVLNERHLRLHPRRFKAKVAVDNGVVDGHEGMGTGRVAVLAGHEGEDGGLHARAQREYFHGLPPMRCQGFSG